MNVNQVKAPILNTKVASSNTMRKAPEVAFKGLKNTKLWNSASKFADQYIIENIAKGIGKVSDLKGTEGIMKAIGKWKSPYQRLCDIGSIVLTVFTVKDTLKSKKISDERKPFMVVNNILVTAVSSTLAALIDNLTYTPQEMIASGYAQKIKEKINPDVLKEFANDKHNKKIIDNAKTFFGDTKEALENAYIFKNTEKFMTGLGKFKSTFIFTAIVRFLVPIAFVPITAKIIDKLEARAKNKKSQQSAQPISQPQAPAQMANAPAVATQPLNSVNPSQIIPPIK